MPPNLIIDPATGTISGTPSAPFSNEFTVQVVDSTGPNSAMEQPITITITAELKITTTSIPRGTRGTTYFQSIAATGGAQPYTFTLGAGALPGGVGLASNGNISGTPNEFGTFNFTVHVTDNSSGVRFDDKSFTLYVDKPVSITTTRLNDGTVGSAYNQPLAATGGLLNTPNVYQWNLYSGNLPQGLSLNPASGVITGTPLAPTYTTVVISASDDYGRVTYKTFTIQTANPLAVQSTSLPDGLVNELYSEAIHVTGGIPPYSFSYAGVFPDGLQLLNGVITGKPTTAGTKQIIVTVTDSSNPAQPASVSPALKIRINAGLTITTPAVLTNVKRNTAITQIILNAKGGTQPCTWCRVSGALPQGLTLDPSGTISGTPADKGDFAFTLQATDTASATAQKEFFLHVSDIISITTGAAPDAVLNNNYYFAFSAKGGLPPYSWSKVNGTLPGGLTLNANGTITGKPTSATSQPTSFTVQVNDSDSPAQTTQHTYLMQVLNDLYIYTSELPNTRLNQAYDTTISAGLGQPPYNWQITAGTLPTGLNFTNSPTVALISGEPTEPGTYSFTIEVNDTGTPVKSVSRQFVIIVYADLAITTTALNPAVRGTGFSDDIVATGGELPYLYVITSGKLPAGLKMDPASGHISGTTAGNAVSSTITVTVTDSGIPMGTAVKDLTILAIDPLEITTANIQGALQKSFYQVTFAGNGGLSPYNWTIDSGLPQGLTLDPATGILSGISAECGTFDFTVQLLDAAPVPNTATKAFNLNVVCSNDYDLIGKIGSVSGVNIAMTGTKTGTAKTDVAGTFKLQHLTNGSYTIKPTKLGYWFVPETKTVNINNLDMPGVNFAPHADTTPPTGSIIINNGAASTNKAAVVLTLAATDVGSGVVTAMQFSVDGTNWPDPPEVYKTTKAWTLPTGDGSKTIYVKFKDKAGNWSVEYSDTILLDTIVPSGTVAVQNGAAYTNTATVTLNISASDAGSGVAQMCISNTATCAATAWVPYAKTKTGWILPAGDGSKTVNVWFRDKAGNVIAAPASDTITLDTTPPDTTITAKPANPSRYQGATFTFTSPDAAAVFECRLDASAWATCVSPKAYAGLIEGSHSFRVRAKDNAGNSDATPATYTWTIDLTVSAEGLEEGLYRSFHYGTMNDGPYAIVTDKSINPDSAYAMTPDEELAIDAGPAAGLEIAIKKTEGMTEDMLTGTYTVGQHNSNGTALYEYAFDGKGTVLIREQSTHADAAASYAVEADGKLLIRGLTGQVKPDGEVMALTDNKSSMFIGAKQSSGMTVQILDGEYEEVEITSGDPAVTKGTVVFDGEGSCYSDTESGTYSTGPNGTVTVFGMTGIMSADGNFLALSAGKDETYGIRLLTKRR